MQPFHKEDYYRSKIWPEITFYYKQEHLLISSTNHLDTVSSALWGGGVSKASHFVNWKVPLKYHAADPENEILDYIHRCNYPPDFTIGMQTAADIQHASVMEEEGDQFGIIICSTAGTRNAARAGKSYETFSSYKSSNETGTINIFLFLNAKLTPAAMINTMITVTEAKSAALQDLKICDQKGDSATGTTTDSIVIAVNPDSPYSAVHRYAGVATTIGNATGRLTYQSVYEAVKKEMSKA